MTKWFDSFRGHREEGQTMAEYAVVLGAIAVACVVAFTGLAGGVSNAINAAAGMFG
jgi:Flp pilus assembly pilin Flp